MQIKDVLIIIANNNYAERCGCRKAYKHSSCLITVGGPRLMMCLSPIPFI